MSKRKSVYFIKIYRRAKERNLALDFDFGAFSSPKKALEWLMVNKGDAIKEFACGHNRKNLFFALMEYYVDSPGNEWFGVGVMAIDLDGNKTDFFKK